MVCPTTKKNGLFWKKNQLFKQFKSQSLERKQTPFKKCVKISAGATPVISTSWQDLSVESNEKMFWQNIL